MTTKRSITIYQDSDALAAAAAELFRKEAGMAIAERGRFVIALAGGSTPEKMYALLAQNGGGAVEWDKIFCFFGDERFVPPDSKDSNFGMANRMLLSRVTIPAPNIFQVRSDTPNAAQSAADYEQRMANFFGVPLTGPPPVFDLALLGLGDDGHTASLFPGKPSVNVMDHWAVSTPPGTLPPPVERVTLTFPVINAARQVAFLVSGAKKADIVRDVIESDARLHDHPAALVMPTQGQLTWMLDRDAASKLE